MVTLKIFRFKKHFDIIHIVTPSHRAQYMRKGRREESQSLKNFGLATIMARHAFRFEGLIGVKVDIFTIKVIKNCPTSSVNFFSWIGAISGQKDFLSSSPIQQHTEYDGTLSFTVGTSTLPKLNQCVWSVRTALWVLRQSLI